MNRHTKHHIVNGRRDHGTTVGALLLASLAVAILLAGGITGGAGPATSGGLRPIRGEIVPVEQTRILEVTAYAFDGEPPACDIEKHDGAVDFEEYDNTLIADCSYGKGEASQQSSINDTFLSADGYTYAHGCPGGGIFADGSGDSVFEVVFDSSTTQWCTLSGQISTEWADCFGGGLAEVVLIGPGEIILFEARLEDENGVIPFDEEILLVEGGRYTLRAASEVVTEFEAIQNEYSVLLELAGEVPADDVGVLAVNNPPAEFPAGECPVNLTIANYGSEDQEVPVRVEVLEPAAVFMDEGFDGSFPPPGWSQEEAGEWQLHEGNEAGGAAPEVWLERDNIIGDYAFLDSAPVDTTGAARLIVEFKHRFTPSGNLGTVYSRSSPDDPWTDITPWPNPAPDIIGPETRRIEITHDIGPATQVRWEFEDPDLGPMAYGYWHLNDVKIYALATTYESDKVVSVPAFSMADVEFTPAWEAPEGLYVLDAATQLSGDEHPDNDGQSMMLTVGPVTQYEDHKLLASDGEHNDYFGDGVAIDGDWAIIGADGDDTQGSIAGAAYAYCFDGSAWTQQQKLLASDGAAYDWFGCTVAISGDIAIISAYGDENENGDDAGAAYVFRCDGSAWYEEAKLIASDGAEDDMFGADVDLDGDLAIVGASRDDDNGENSGSAYIFRFDGSQWIEEQRLLASDGAENDRFGEHLRIDGDQAVVGAFLASNDQGVMTGAAYVFRYDGSEWVEEAKLLASDGADDDCFGGAVAIAGDRIVVGARRDDDLGDRCGAAYVFRYDRGAWIEEAKLLPTDAAVDHEFGLSLAAEGDTVAVGAWRYFIEGEGGCAYLFTHEGPDWTQTTRLMASDGEEQDKFGLSVAISGNSVLVGADGSGDDVGAAYVFASPIPGDIDGDGDVDTADLLALLGAWGPCEACPEDIDGNGVVNTADLLILLGNWG